MRKIYLPLLLAMVFGAIIFMGQTTDDPKAEKWSVDPRSTQLYYNPAAQYSPNTIITNNIPKTFTGPVVYNTNAGMLTVNPNLRVHPTTLSTQSEVPITRHPTNESILFASSNAVRHPTSPLFLSEGCYVSTNAGINWFGSDTTFTTVVTGHGGDPAPAIGLNGYFYQSYLGYPTSGMFAAYSTNLGANWSSTYTITTGSQDKNHTFVCDVPSSPYAGRVYVTWSLFSVSSPPCVVAYSTNNGTSYSSYITVATPLSGHYHQGVNGAIMPNGDAIICWQSPLSGSPYTGDYVGFAKSTNGGVNWTANNNVYDCNGIRGTLSNKMSIRVNDFPWMGVDRTTGSRQGWIYIVTGEKNLAPAGSDPDIIFHRSTDGGTTWSAGIRVNQDALNNGKTQYMPALRVDEYGGINVVYYDDRNTSTDSAEVYVSRSIDGGNTWTDILVSDHRFKPKPISGLAGGYQGDYIGITSGNNKVYPYWCDDITGLYQAWITTIDLGPAINHTPLTNTEQTTGTRQVLAQIIPAGAGINPSQTKLFFTKNPSSFTDSVLLVKGTGNNWSANITLSGPGIYRYYLKTVDSINRVATAPGGAPANYFSFIASPDTIKPVITHTPLANVPKVNWPVSTSAVVTDNIGVDSVWVRWYKNNTGTGIKHFKLLPTGGNNYSATFNSVNSDVLVGDSIFYRVFARDNSSGHNTDSTVLYQFKIINQVNVIIGTGTTAIGWPYYTYYMDSRTDMLYLGSEIGIPAPGAYITKIGFDVVSAASQVMNGFQIKMQNTTATSITAFTSTNWTIAYNGTYSVPGSGWQLVTLQTPFYYTGGSNLLIEICFNNSSYTSNSTVNGAAATGRNVHQHSDLSSGDGCTAITTPGTTYTQLPNIQLVMNPGPTGIEQKGNEIPTKYELAQNYPNPFNPTTKINFAIPKQGMVTLKVYDVLGREVANLVNEVKTAGNYIVDFDASALSSGVYFYKIDVNGFSDVKRMMLIK
jgi:hypothetical protein